MALDTGALDTEVRDGPAPAARPDSALPGLTPRLVWQRGRVAIVLGLVVLVVAALVAITSGRIRGGYLTPDGTRPPGARAIAQLLVDRGVDVVREDRPALEGNTTTFVPFPELVPPADLAPLLKQSAHDVVLVAPMPDYLVELADEGAPLVTVHNEVEIDERAPGCSEESADTAGVAQMGGLVYGAPQAEHSCYPAQGGATLIVVRAGTSRLVVVGDGEFLTNRSLDEEGNAALALGLLGRHDTVHWLLPGPDAVPAGTGRIGIVSLLPDRLVVAVWQIAIAILLLALARARRLGRLVVEPLPVVVRATESVEGRARLYHSGNARGRAADALRTGARDRIVRSLGLRPEADPPDVLGAVAAHVRGGEPLLERLLYGPPPSTDAELVRLAADLDNLEREVRNQ